MNDRNLPALASIAAFVIVVSLGTIVLMTHDPEYQPGWKEVLVIAAMAVGFVGRFAMGRMR